METGNSLTKMLWRFIKPEPNEFIVFCLLIVIFAGISTYRVASEGRIGTDTQDLVAFTAQAVTTVTSYLSTGSFWAKFFLFGFWFVIGTLAYFLFWFLINLIVDFYNDIVISAAFVHPRSFHQSDYWLSIAGRAAIRIMAAIAFGFYSIFWLWVLAPVWLYSFDRLFNDLSNTIYALEAMTTVLFILLSLHIAFILLRLGLFRPTVND